MSIIIILKFIALNFGSHSSKFGPLILFRFVLYDQLPLNWVKYCLYSATVNRITNNRGLTVLFEIKKYLQSWQPYATTKMRDTSEKVTNRCWPQRPNKIGHTKGNYRCGGKTGANKKKNIFKIFLPSIPTSVLLPFLLRMQWTPLRGGWGCVKSVSGLFPTYSHETNEDCAAQPKIYKQKDKCLYFVNRFLLLFGNSLYKYLWKFLLVFLLSPPPSQRAFNKPCVIIYVNSGLFFSPFSVFLPPSSSSFFVMFNHCVIL